MGRRTGKKRTQSRDFKQSRENVWRPNMGRKTDDWTPLDMKNEAFEEYYRQQNIVPEGEWEDFMASLRKTLPTTFRINGSGKFAEALLNHLETDFLTSFSSGPIRVGGEVLQPPKPLLWYPRKLAWQMDASRAQLRKLDALAAVHEFMKKENDAGGITRQEAVSMVPPLFLDVQPHHRVLDMCAAPGSKTFQLLEALHETSNTPPGLVIANDADAQRCNLLTHQVKRMCSPALIVTNHEAQQFPQVTNPAQGDKPAEPVLFDRILCDVPCSGDGTIRKSPDIWRKWSAANGNGLHPLQLRITLRACSLLQVGGRLVYSTCTFNPVEDEAVVAEVLRRTGGAMELVDVTGHLPTLKRLQGVSSWKVLSGDNTTFLSSWADAVQAEAPKVDPTMFPDEASAQLPLHRCMRVLPHHGDTGGFFIAVLQKVAPLGTLAPVTLTHRYKYGGKEGVSGRKRPAERPAEPPTPTADDAAAHATPEAAAEAVTSADQAAQAADAAPSSAAAAAATDVSITAVGSAEPPVTAAAAAADGAAAPASGDAAAANGAAAPQGQNQQGGWGRGRGRDGGGRWGGLDPVLPVTNPDLLESIAAFFGMGSGSTLQGQLVTRNAERDKPKRLYMVGPAVAALLAADEREALRITSTGVKAFERQENKDGSVPCSYRIVQEGLPLLLPAITRQRLELSAPEFLRLLTERSLPIPQRSSDAAEAAAATPAAGEAASRGEPPEAAAAPAPAVDAAAAAAAEEHSGDEADGSKSARKDMAAAAAATKQQKAKGAAERPRGPPLSDERTVEQLEHISNGCCVATLRDEEAVELGLPTGSKVEGALTAAAPLALTCWRGRTTLNILVAKPECAHMATKLRDAQARINPGAAAASGVTSPKTQLNPHAPEFKPQQPEAAGCGEGVTLALKEGVAHSDPADVAAAVAVVGNKRSVSPGAVAAAQQPSTKKPTI